MQSVARVPRSLGGAALRQASVGCVTGSSSHAPRGTSAAEFIAHFSAHKGSRSGFSKRCVQLRSVAYEYVPSPKSTLVCVFLKFRQAVRASKSLRLAGRFASSLRSVTIPSESVANRFVSVAYRVPAVAGPSTRH